MEQESIYHTASPAAVAIVWAVVLFVAIYFSLVSFSFDFLKCKKGRIRPWCVFCWSIVITLLVLIFMWVATRFATYSSRGAQLDVHSTL